MFISKQTRFRVGLLKVDFNFILESLEMTLRYANLPFLSFYVNFCEI